MMDLNELIGMKLEELEVLYYKTFDEMVPTGFYESYSKEDIIDAIMSNQPLKEINDEGVEK